MEISLVLVLFAVVGIFLVFWFDSFSNIPLWHFWRSKHHREGAHLPPHSDGFHAVSLSSAKECCSAVKSLGSTRFLTAEAPEIPVPGCDRAQCGCVYVHHEDRREGGRDRRLRQDRRIGGRREEGDRRQFRGRRRSDWGPLVQV